MFLTFNIELISLARQDFKKYFHSRLLRTLENIKNPVSLVK